MRPPPCKSAAVASVTHAVVAGCCSVKALEYFLGLWGESAPCFRRADGALFASRGWVRVCFSSSAFAVAYPPICAELGWYLAAYGWRGCDIDYEGTDVRNALALDVEALHHVFAQLGYIDFTACCCATSSKTHSW